MASTTSIEKTAVEKIKSFLNQLLRITTTDGRVFIGTFTGTDKPLNLILLNAEEYRISGPESKSDGRFVGQVIFPWKVVVKVEAFIKQDAGIPSTESSWHFW